MSARVRSAALLLAGAVCLHWLRYLVSYGGSAADELHRQGHGYLSELLPGLLGLCLSLLVMSLVLGAFKSSARAAGSHLRAAAAIFAAGILVVYGAQELAEGVFATGHHAGFQAVTADSGWVAIPIALGLGLGLAWTERLLVKAEARLGSLLTRSERDERPVGAIAPDSPFVPSLASMALAFGFARRPPPVSLSP